METSNERLLQLNNALIQATQNGNLMQIKSLIGQGASKNTRDPVGNTLIMIATQISHFNIVEYFINIGVDVNATNLFQLSALDIAKKNHFPEIAALLKENATQQVLLLSRSCSPRSEDKENKEDSSLQIKPKQKSSKCTIF